jgi:hypothetical protein
LEGIPLALPKNHKSAVNDLTAEDQTMHRSQSGDGWQRNAATNASYSPHATFASCESPIIRHHLLERGADVDLACADHLQANAAQFVEALLLSALRRPSTETVGFARREEIVQHLEQSLTALAMEQEEQASLFASRTSITIPVALGDGASVVFTVHLRWKDRYGPALSMIECRSTIDVPDDDRERFAAWFDGQAAHLNQASNRPLHRLHPDTCGRGA